MKSNKAEVTDARSQMRAIAASDPLSDGMGFTMWKKIEAWVVERNGMAIGRVLDAALALFGAALVSESLWLLFVSL